MRRGPLYMTAAGFFLTVMYSLVKIARAEMSSLDIIFWRGFASLILAFHLARRAGLRLYNVPLFAARVGFGFSAMFCYFQAAKGIAVANMSLIGKLQPILVALFAPLALGSGERAGTTVWLLLFAGLAGCAFLLGGDISAGSSWGLWALGATVLSSGGHICVRGLARTDNSRVIVLYFQLCLMAASALAVLLTRGTLPGLPPVHLWPHLLGVGVTATAGQLCMTQAYAEDRAPVVATASYSSLLWGFAADLIVFSITPTWTVFAGGAIILAAGLILIFGPERSHPERTAARPIA